MKINKIEVCTNELKIIKPTFDNRLPTKFIPLKCLTEVMFYWYLHFT